MLPFTANLLPNPMLSDAQADRVLRAHWGIEATLSDLGSTQDQNLLVTRRDGTRYVLKITEAMWTRADLELQNAAMRHVAAKGVSARHRGRVRCAQRVFLVDGRRPGFLRDRDRRPRCDQG